MKPAKRLKQALADIAKNRAEAAKTTAMAKWLAEQPSSVHKGIDRGLLTVHYDAETSKVWAQATKEGKAA